MTDINNVTPLNPPPKRRYKYKSNPGKPLLEQICQIILEEFGNVYSSALRVGMDPSNLHRYVRSHVKAREAVIQGRKNFVGVARKGFTQRVVDGDARAQDRVMDFLDEEFATQGKLAAATKNDGEAGAGSIQNIIIQAVPRAHFLCKLLDGKDYFLNEKQFELHQAGEHSMAVLSEHGDAEPPEITFTGVAGDYKLIESDDTDSRTEADL